MERGNYQAWLAEADGLSTRQREEAARVLAEPASLASVLALLEARIEGTRRCPHCTTEGAVIRGGGGSANLHSWMSGLSA